MEAPTVPNAAEPLQREPRPRRRCAEGRAGKPCGPAPRRRGRAGVAGRLAPAPRGGHGRSRRRSAVFGPHGPGPRWVLSPAASPSREQTVPHSSRIEEDPQEAVFREVVSFTPAPLPVRYYDTDTSSPISFYFSSLEELLAWTPGVEDGFHVALSPPACRQPPLSSGRPRTLLCHDMMGGYLDDRFVQGSAAQNPYTFYHWQYVDIFVYFSHHTVTIPPVGWTNAAHRHGVCVLGTFITEWKGGEQLCEAFLAADERSYQAVADQLVLIAQFLRFDGWLVNIENTLSVSMAPAWRSAPPCRRAAPLRRVLGLTPAHARAAPKKGRSGVWLDPPLGGYGSLELIRTHGFSVALFAPGWVYECFEKTDFFQNEDKSPAETSSRHSPRPLRVPPPKLARWTGRCGQHLSGGWVQRCYEVSLRGCRLQDLFVSFSRPLGSREEEDFVCRLGELQVVDANSLLTPLPHVQATSVSHVRWQQTPSQAEGPPAGLRLSCTLHCKRLG
ncbi:cytosolic endo-beta-N-acetylglucosaminidase [Pteropus medius]|uniref:cytosolic endo-beta-N-acetylglucosaminidase n=1 Tax=Pteropus vampyrus TaxID=132908 RepID=UPI00196B4CFA|nr:cytosolic endo-beta-N-acetylglucosaminidase [Pteropus giganteus]